MSCVMKGNHSLAEAKIGIWRGLTREKLRIIKEIVES